MKYIKSFSSKACNKILGRTGQFWQKESFDRLVRDETELRRILVYILQNPVKYSLFALNAPKNPKILPPADASFAGFCHAWAI